MISTEQLTQFGISLDDEFSHPFSEDHPDWNESYFFDWYNEAGTIAGHCRIGWHPVQQRILFWLHVYHKGEWLIIEENRLPFSDLQLSQPKAFCYDRWGLHFSYTNQSPLQTGVLQVEGFARVTTGERQGMVLPIALSLDFQALGPAHSRGGGEVESHSAQGFSTNRYEQPIKAQCTLSIDNKQQQLEVRGERDHSWGPRPWDMVWRFLVVNNQHFTLQATEVEIPEWPLIQIGYFNELGQDMEHIEAMSFDIDFEPLKPHLPVSGAVTIECQSGRKLAGNIETISASEIDITHAFNPVKRTEYRRALIRCQFDDGTHSIGWLEYNRPANNNNNA